MIIRWLGCYGKNGNLAESFVFEFNSAQKALCAERLLKSKGYQPGVPERVRVGLLVKNSAVVRRFKEDVFSVRNQQGYLRKTRKGCGGFGSHTEVWVLPQYCGIVVRGKWASISRESQAIVSETARKHNLPVFVLANGQLNEI